MAASKSSKRPRQPPPPPTESPVVNRVVYLSLTVPERVAFMSLCQKLKATSVTDAMRQLLHDGFTKYEIPLPPLRDSIDVLDEQTELLFATLNGQEASERSILQAFVRWRKAFLAHERIVATPQE